MTGTTGLKEDAFHRIYGGGAAPSRFFGEGKTGFAE